MLINNYNMEKYILHYVIHSIRHVHTDARVIQPVCERYHLPFRRSTVDQTGNSDTPTLEINLMSTAEENCFFHTLLPVSRKRDTDYFLSRWQEKTIHFYDKQYINNNEEE